MHQCPTSQRGCALRDCTPLPQAATDCGNFSRDQFPNTVERTQKTLVCAHVAHARDAHQ